MSCLSFYPIGLIFEEYLKKDPTILVDFLLWGNNFKKFSLLYCRSLESKLKKELIIIEYLHKLNKKYGTEFKLGFKSPTYILIGTILNNHLILSKWLLSCQSKFISIISPDQIDIISNLVHAKTVEFFIIEEGNLNYVNDYIFAEIPELLKPFCTKYNWQNYHKNRTFDLNEKDYNFYRKCVEKYDQIKNKFLLDEQYKKEYLP